MGTRRPIRIARALALARLARVHTPLVASLAVTDACNMDCAYCDRRAVQSETMPTERWLAILDQLAAAGCVQVSFTGGEPLMRTDLGELAEHAARRGLHPVLNTNGYLLGRHLELLDRVSAVTLSLDGPQEVHDELRRAGSHERVLDACARVREWSLPLTLYTVLSRSNLPHLGYLLSVARRFGARIAFQPGVERGFFHGTRNPASPEPEAYRAAIDLLIRAARAGEPVMNSTAGLRYLRSWPGPAPIPCPGERLFCRVEPDGRLRICGRDDYGADPPDLRRHGLGEALARLEDPGCEACWSSARVEFHLLSRGNPSALWAYLR